MANPQSKPHKRGPWSATEDQQLIQCVIEQGPNNWVRISNEIESRTPKQCRERYHQNLKPGLKHEPITIREGEIIQNAVREIGKRWAEIARRLPGRSDNAVKNWWNGVQNRNERRERRRNEEENRLRSVSRSSTSLPPPAPHMIQAPVGHYRQRGSSWPEAALPSPCSSEPPEFEGYSHSASPNHTGVYQHHSVDSADSVELPPLLNLNLNNKNHDRLSNTLPVLSKPLVQEQAAYREQASYREQAAHLDQRYAQHANYVQHANYAQHANSTPRAHLPTAPSSPTQNQQSSGSQNRDSRMNLSSLLG